MSESDSTRRNPEWENVARGFVGELVARRRPMLERIAAHTAAPIRRGRLWRAAERFFPRIARKIGGRARWSGALMGRVSALSERIGRAFAFSDLQAEPIERVWLEEEMASEPAFSPEESGVLAEAPPGMRTAALPPGRAAQPSRGAEEPAPARAAALRSRSPAAGIRRSPPARVMRFAAQARARLERPPLVAFSCPVLEGLGVLAPRGPEPAAESAAFGTPSRPVFEESAERGIPPTPMPPTGTAAVQRIEPPPAGVTGLPIVRERASAESSVLPGSGRPRAVSRYIQRAREPLAITRGRPGEGIASRPAAFEGIIRREPVTVGFTPPAPPEEPEAPVSRTLEAPPFRAAVPAPPAPVRPRWGGPVGEPAPPEPLTPPQSPRPTEPARPRAAVFREADESALFPLPRRERPSSIPPPDASVSRSPKKAPPGGPSPGVSEPVQTSPAAPEIAGGRAGLPQPERPSRPEPERAAPSAAPGREHLPAPGAEPAAKPIDLPPGLRRTEMLGRRPAPPETAAPEPTTPQAPPPIVLPEAGRMPSLHAPPAAPGRIERKERAAGEERLPDRPLPSEALPSLAETVQTRYTPPRGIRRIERIPLPVSAPQGFESLFAAVIGRRLPSPTPEPLPGKAEEVFGPGESFAAGMTRGLFAPPSGRPEISRMPAPARRVWHPIPSGTSPFPGEPEPARTPTAPGERRYNEGAAVGMESGARPSLVSALYRRPASIGTKMGIMGRDSEILARAAAAPAAESAAGRPAEGTPPAAGESRAEGPDLDAIAREVYAIIRRRLAIERERLGR